MQSIFLHIFYSIPHSAAVQAKNVLPHKILRYGRTQKVLRRNFSIQRLPDCIIYSFCSFATRRRTAVTRPQSPASTVYRIPWTPATQNMFKYTQTHREIEVLADTSYCFIVYALATVNNTLLTSSCTLHSRKFLR